MFAQFAEICTWEKNNNNLKVVIGMAGSRSGLELSSGVSVRVRVKIGPRG